MRAGWVIGLALAAPAMAQDTPPVAPPPPLQLWVSGQAETATIRPGVPTPLCVDVAVPGGVPDGGVVEVVAHTPLGTRVLWRVVVDAPPGSRRRYLGLGLRTPDNADVVEARWTRDTELLGKARVAVQAASAERAWVWVFANEGLPEAVPGLSRALAAKQPAGLTDWEREEWKPAWGCTFVDPSALPADWLAFAGADAVVVPPPLQQVSVEFTLAFSLWVELGGRALVGGGSYGHQLHPGFSAMLPVTPSQVLRLDARPLAAALRGGRLPAEPVMAAVAAGPVRAGRRYAHTTNEVPLCLLHAPGLGRVVWLATALDDTDVRPLACTDQALQLLLRGQRRSVIARTRMAWDPPVPPRPLTDEEQQAAGTTPVPRWHEGTLRIAPPEMRLPLRGPDNLPTPKLARELLLRDLAVTIPTRRELVAWLVGYLCLAGLCLWAGHRWSVVGRAWVAVGVLGVAAFVAVSSVAAATYDAVTAGRALLLAEGAIGSRRVAVAGTCALYTPQGGPTTLALPAPIRRVVLAGRRLAGVPTHAAAGASVAFDAFPRELESADVSGMLDLGGVCSVELVESPRGDVLRVRNATARSLRGVWVAHGARWAAVGDLASGQVREVAPEDQAATNYTEQEPADLWRQRALGTASGDDLVLVAALDVGLATARLGAATVEGAPQVALILHGTARPTTGVEAPAAHGRVMRAVLADPVRARRARFTTPFSPGAGPRHPLPVQVAVAEIDDAPWWAGAREGVVIELRCSLDALPPVGARLILPTTAALEWIDARRRDGRAPPLVARVTAMSVRTPGPNGRWFLRDADGTLGDVRAFLTPDLELDVRCHIQLSHDDWSPAPDAVEPDPSRRLRLRVRWENPRVASSERPK